MKHRMPNYDLLIKMLVVGDAGVGKTSFMHRYFDDEFPPSNNMYGIDFKIRNIQLDGKKIKLQIWDAPVQERLEKLFKSYYRAAMGFLLVYDVTNHQSFLNIRNWIRKIGWWAEESVNKILIGNKCDVTERREVTREQ